MDRFSLGISVDQSEIQAVLYNVDQKRVGACESLAFSDGFPEPLLLLQYVDEIFKLLHKYEETKQVLFVQVVGVPDKFTCLSKEIYQKFMYFSAYAESLSKYFEPCFIDDEWFSFSDLGFIQNKRESEDVSLMVGISELLTILLAGKMAPMSMGLACWQGYGYDVKKKNFTSDSCENKFVDIQSQNKSFSYLSSYFVEKFQIYRECQVLPAERLESIIGVGAGFPLYIYLDQAVTGGLLLNESIEELVSVENISQLPNGQWLRILAPYSYEISHNLLKSLMKSSDISSCYENFLNDPVKSGEFTSKEAYFFHQLSLIKEQLGGVEVIACGGPWLSENMKDLISWALSCQVVTHDYSRFLAALSASLIAARKVTEGDLRETLDTFFESEKTTSFFTSKKQEVLGIHIQYQNLGDQLSSC